MGKKRMFNTDILESDAFTSMSAQAQILYVHLCMHADDDGLLSNAQWVMRGLNIQKSRMQELLGKRFLLDLGDGITCIKHWWINNTLRKDTYKPTAYTEKLDLLKVKENGAYTDDCNASVTTFSKPCNASVTAEGKGCNVDKISKGKLSKGKYNRKRLPDFYIEEGESTDIEKAREKMFGKEKAS